jgi:hypothetical protein
VPAREWIELLVHVIGVFVCGTLGIHSLFRLFSPLWSAKARARMAEFNARAREKQTGLNFIVTFSLAALFSFLMMIAFSIVPM